MRYTPERLQDLRSLLYWGKEWAEVQSARHQYVVPGGADVQKFTKAVSRYMAENSPITTTKIVKWIKEKRHAAFWGAEERMEFRKCLVREWKEANSTEGGCFVEHHIVPDIMHSRPFPCQCTSCPYRADVDSLRDFPWVLARCVLSNVVVCPTCMDKSAEVAELAAEAILGESSKHAKLSRERMGINMGIWQSMLRRRRVHEEEEDLMREDAASERSPVRTREQMEAEEKEADCLYFYDRSAHLTPGEGVWEGVADTAKYRPLQDITDWRRMLADGWACSFHMNGRLYRTAHHALCAAHLYSLGKSEAADTLDARHGDDELSGSIAAATKLLKKEGGSLADGWEGKEEAILRIYVDKFKSGKLRSALLGTGDARLYTRACARDVQGPVEATVLMRARQWIQEKATP